MESDLPPGWTIAPLLPRVSHADLMQVLRENPDFLAALVPETKRELIAFVRDYASWSCPEAEASFFAALDKLIPDDAMPA
jgi:hypothetical protein